VTLASTQRKKVYQVAIKRTRASHSALVCPLDFTGIVFWPRAMNTKNLNVVCAITLSAMTVVACGGSGSDESSVLTGVFVDSPVAGMKYVTPTVSGVTTADGEFNYRAGEAVVFSVGNLALPVVIASDTVTPLDMTTTDDINDAAVINVARLLQSLDEDGDPSNDRCQQSLQW